MQVAGVHSRRQQSTYSQRKLSCVAPLCSSINTEPLLLLAAAGGWCGSQHMVLTVHVRHLIVYGGGEQHAPLPWFWGTSAEENDCPPPSTRTHANTRRGAAQVVPPCYSMPPPVSHMTS
jgi:hypothetical protein